jgi:hypothetical protein
MNNAVNDLVRSVIRKNALSECSVSELERLVAQYPYFGPAQFLLAQKLKEENSPLYEQQYQKAILYFKDHLWFDYLSRNEDINGIIQPAAITEPVAQQPPAENQFPAETTNEVEQSTDHSPEQQTAQQETTENIPVEIHSSSDSVNGHEQVNNNGSDQQTDQWKAEPELKTQEEPTITSVEEPEPDQEETSPEEEQETGPALPQFKIQPLNAQAATLTFEPYHTIDYFASQGIKVKEEEKPKDRFSQQLKSFTEWLKAMKKLPETETTLPPATPDDPKVTKMAEHSLVDRDVVTEAMADVWEQQGNREKAIETYSKLSLLNPSKSAYFAAKIEHLKHP